VIGGVDDLAQMLDQPGQLSPRVVALLAALARAGSQRHTRLRVAEQSLQSPA